MPALFPTAYFGSIAYFRELLRFSEVSIEVHETFPKQTFRNRCNVLTAQGEQRLTVPVIKPDGSRSVTKDILISEQQDWRNLHWRTIFSAYGSAPYFEHYARDIEALIFRKEERLVDLNKAITETVVRLFDAEITLDMSSSFTKAVAPPENDFRDRSFDEASDKNMIPYTQVLFTPSAFVSNLSILDLLFCEGPMGRKQLIFS